MPKIYDNVENEFLFGLSDALKRSHRSDICVGFFNLRGWKLIAKEIDQYQGGEDQKCRFLLGMYNPTKDIEEEIQEEDQNRDNKIGTRLKKQAINHFKNQLSLGVFNDEDEKGLKKLAKQIKDKKVSIKIFTRYSLHAKLYLTFNKTEFSGYIGFLGSSNLTFSGLKKQGELNIDILDGDSCNKLSNWFEDKWNDNKSIDISNEILELIEKSWVSDEYTPYDIYIKMAYHLSEEARDGLNEFSIPKTLDKTLFEFQKKAVSIACSYIDKRNGVFIGDVVGLGKTLTATAIAKTFEEEKGYQTLILCPPNLQEMWNEHRQTYRIRGEVRSIYQSDNLLKELSGRWGLVIIDESHNLRNSQGKKYGLIKDFIKYHDSKCVLLSATPYNKTYKDLSDQMALFLDKDEDLGVIPAKYLKENPHFDGNRSSLKAFEDSPYSEDWQQLMDKFLVRRTRSFIKKYYAKKTKDGKFYLETSKKEKNFFPNRTPKTIRYDIDEQYKKLFSKDVIQLIDNLKLARYDLSSYEKKGLKDLTQEEKKILQDLKKGQSYPKGFCKMNLFKRLESSGYSFLQSIQRHILRNYIFIYAIKEEKNLIVRDKGGIISGMFEEKDEEITACNDEILNESVTYFYTDSKDFENKAKKTYARYEEKKKRVRWISSKYFKDQLLHDIESDTHQLLSILKKSKNWKPQKDLKLNRLYELLHTECKNKKAIVFTQYSETAKYILEQLKEKGYNNLELITGGMDNIQSLVKRFSPKSNKYKLNKESEFEIQTLISTDVLSEGQNLQDCHIVINYDVPWAIIRLIQRAGRIDRIGQKSTEVLCYTFVPNKDLEEHLSLMERIKRRLKENKLVLGADEIFFEDEKKNYVNLYNEEVHAIEEKEGKIDLPSYAYEVWQSAIKKNPQLEEKIKNSPPMIYSSKSFNKEGAILFTKTYAGNHLVFEDRNKNLNEDHYKVFEMAECEPKTPSIPKVQNFYKQIKEIVNKIRQSLKNTNPSGLVSRSPRRKLLDHLEQENIGIDSDVIETLINDVVEYPLTHQSERILKKKFRNKESIKSIIQFVRDKDREDNLFYKKKTKQMDAHPKILCSMGLIKQEK